MRKGNYFSKSELEMFNSQNPIFNEAQMKILNRKTPASEIEVKTDISGNQYKSVKAPYMKALLMLVTGGNFNFEIKEQAFLSSAKEIRTTGKLTIFNGEKAFVREQNGKAESNIPEANSFKASSSDCFKKCMSEFGFCWDIYGQDRPEQKKEEAPEVTQEQAKKLQRLVHFLKAANTAAEIENVYNTFLETGEETESSKSILEIHYNRVCKKE